MENRRRSARLVEMATREKKPPSPKKSPPPKTTSRPRARSVGSSKSMRVRRNSLPAQPTYQVEPPPPQGEVQEVKTFSKDDKHYRMTAHVTEPHESHIYGCSFNHFRRFPAFQLLAIVANRDIRIYSFPPNEKTFKLIKQGKLPGERAESLYVVAWCKQAKDRKRYSMIVTGGATGKLYVLDFHRLKLKNVLHGCRGGINDIRTSPVVSTQIVVACVDLAVRIFDIRCSAALVICGAVDGHDDNVLSVDWGLNADHVYSAGYDHKIIMWDLKSPLVAQHLKNANKALNRAMTPSKRSTEANRDRPSLEMRTWDPKQKAIFLLDRVAQTNKLHFDSIDCLRVYSSKNKKRDYLISKNCGEVPRAFLWRFGASPGVRETVSPGDWQKSHHTLCHYEIENNWIPFFMKFAIDSDSKTLLVGGGLGEVQIFNLKSGKVLHTVSGRGGLVRQIDFCQGGHFFATVSDYGHICRYDRVADVPEEPSTEAPLTIVKSAKTDNTVPKNRRRNSCIVIKAPTSTGVVTRRRSSAIRGTKRDPNILAVPFEPYRPDDEAAPESSVAPLEKKKEPLRAPMTPPLKITEHPSMIYGFKGFSPGSPSPAKSTKKELVKKALGAQQELREHYPSDEEEDVRAPRVPDRRVSGTEWEDFELFYEEGAQAPVVAPASEEDKENAKTPEYRYSDSEFEDYEPVEALEAPLVMSTSTVYRANTPLKEALVQSLVTPSKDDKPKAPMLDPLDHSGAVTQGTPERRAPSVELWESATRSGRGYAVVGDEPAAGGKSPKSNVRYRGKWSPCTSSPKKPGRPRKTSCF